MHVFGLTGGMASGKSVVSARFRERGLAIVDADAVSREVPVPGSEALDLLVKEFGADILLGDGTLDRKKLSARVFGSPDKLKRLNAIMLPRIAMLAAERTAECGARGEPLVCYDAPLLVENNLADAFRPLVVVSAPEELQVARAIARDGLTEEHVRARIAAQLPLAEKVRAADLVIENDGTLEALRAKADAALDEVCRRTDVDPARYKSVQP